MKRSVVVGLSGGIDSSVTALLLKQSGYDVSGLYLVFYDEQLNHLEHVKKICSIVDIPFSYLDARKIFKEKVINYYFEERLKGKTPSPCIQCNPNVKWDLIQSFAKKNNISFIATGHYIQIKKINNLYRLLKGTDESKDQSYYLWQLSQEILKRAIFPLGDLTKTEVKEIAQQHNLVFLTEKKESTGLCFAQNIDNQKYIDQLLKEKSIEPKPGKVYDSKNNLIGSHDGLVYYTVGQKKGLKLNVPQKLCVKKMNEGNNSIIADTWQNLYTHELNVTDYLIPDPKDINCSDKIQVKVRGFGLNPAPGAQITVDGQILKIKLHHPAWAIAPGQPVVFYLDDLIVGGGIITE